MDHVYSTTTEHKKGKHLTYDERVIIQVRFQDGWSANKIVLLVADVMQPWKNLLFLAM